MKNFVMSILAFAVISCSAAPSPAPVADPAAAPDDITSYARELVDAFAENNWPGVTARFDTTMRQSLTVAQLGQVRSALASQLGTFLGIRSTRPASEGGYRVIYVRSGFEKGDVDAKVVFNANNEVAGLFFVPAAQ